MSESEPRTREVRFRESMPRPLIVIFAMFAIGCAGLIVYLMVRPPSQAEVALERRRSAPSGSLTHDVVEFRMVDVPATLPAFDAPCPALAGVVIEGGEPAVERLGAVLRSLCRITSSGASEELLQAVHGLSRARLRFALFTRTGDQTSADLGTGRVLMSVVLSRTNVAPVTLAPLLVHEGMHLAAGGPVSAAREFRARVAELEACRALIEPDRFPRGCRDALALVQLGEEDAVALLVRAGFGAS